MDWQLPMNIDRIGTPPLKSQGIKTKLVPFIAQSISWNPGSGGRWIEPFLGTGCVALNLAPPRALLSDINPHVIGVLRAIQKGVLTPLSARQTLAQMGQELSSRGEEFYYEVRQRFNETGDPMDFLFLNRTSFNGIIRFSKKSGFNTPFGHKPERFSPSFLTKVANQIAWAKGCMAGKDWVFAVQDWRVSIADARADDFIYLDPPYIGRNADYFSQWNANEATSLAASAISSPAGYALSMWLENEHRKNDHINESWSGSEIRTAAHFYHVGASEEQRKPMTEALAIRSGFATVDPGVFVTGRSLKARLDDRALVVLTT
jgi:DNA adenine methylase